jgi:membrane dipeptidase
MLLVACGRAREARPTHGSNNQLADDSESALLARARGIHEGIITLDGHAGFASNPLRSCGETDRQVDFSKMRRGGLNAVFFTAYAAQRALTDQGYAEAKRQGLEAFQAIHDLVRACSEDAGLARAPADVERIVAGSRIAVAIGMENGFMIGPDLTLLERYAELGGAYLGLTHDGHNAIADAAIPREDLGDALRKHGGVSSFGERVIAELNRLGIMVDVSHMSKAATLDAIRLSRAPVIASHSSMHALVPHPRNIDDETLVAMAVKGGVVQITAVHEFVKVDPPGAMEAFYALLNEFDIETEAQARTLPPDRRAEFEKRNAEMLERWPLATVAHLVDHIDHAVGLVGVDHVGIGSDFEGGAGLTGWAHAGETVNVTAELLRRGYTAEEIGKMWSGNLLRVWREVQQLAEDLR